jgi:hypothetical protein
MMLLQSYKGPASLLSLLLLLLVLPIGPARGRQFRHICSFFQLYLLDLDVTLSTSKSVNAVKNCRCATIDPDTMPESTLESKKISKKLSKK